jgi:predicted RNA-binding Zn-ribbon protein involved in translation (DUF1610 family)
MARKSPKKVNRRKTMSSVFEKDVECPLCGGNTAHTDLECNTNEREWDCERCGFHSHTKIVERGGKLFWEVHNQLPMSPEGKVAWPALKAVEATGWSAKEFGTMPSWNKISEADAAEFGVEEAESTDEGGVELNIQVTIKPDNYAVVLTPDGKDMSRQYPPHWTTEQVKTAVCRILEEAGYGQVVSASLVGITREGRA